MTNRLLLLSLGVLLHTANASEPVARAAANASPAASANAAARPATASGNEAARRELGELREQIGVLSRRMAELSMQLGDIGPQAFAFNYLNDADRAMIGVVLSPRAAGPQIDAVTPDGPAERAGLRSGDVLTSIKGQALDVGDAGRSLDKARKLLADLKPGDSIVLAYRRGGGKVLEATLKAERREAWNWQRLFADRDPKKGDLAIDLDKYVDLERDTSRAMHTIDEDDGEKSREAATSACMRPWPKRARPCVRHAKRSKDPGWQQPALCRRDTGNIFRIVQCHAVVGHQSGDTQSRPGPLLRRGQRRTRVVCEQERLEGTARGRRHQKSRHAVGSSPGAGVARAARQVCG